MGNRESLNLRFSLNGEFLKQGISNIGNLTDFV